MASVPQSRTSETRILPGIVRRLLRMLLALLVLSMAFGHWSIHQEDILPYQAAVVTGSPDGDPCGSTHGAAYHAVNCVLSISCSACAPIEVSDSLGIERSTMVAARVDLPRRSTESAPPFHPPKISVIA